MFSIDGRQGRLCDGITRREMIEVGSASLLGLSLANVLKAEKASAAEAAPAGGGPGFGKAKSVIFLFLQGGPSHLDIWDPKPDAPENIRGKFNPIQTKTPGLIFSEHMPRLAQVTDKVTMIQSVSYTPVGLFNHTAAHYQMLTGYTPDKVSPSGQLEPPSPRDFPNIGSVIAKLKPTGLPMFPFVQMPRPMQESNVIGKAGNAGFLGRAYDPYFLFQDPNQSLQMGDLTPRDDTPLARLKRRSTLWETVNKGMPKLQKAVESYALDDYYSQAFDLLLSGKAREAFNLEAETAEMRDRYGRSTFGQSCLLARRLVESGTRFVQVNWPAVANGNPTVDAFDTHGANFGPLKDLHLPKLDPALATLIEDLDQRGLLDETLVLAIGEFGRSPIMGVSTSGNSNAPDGRDHWPYCYTAMIAGAGITRGRVHGKSDKHASSPVADPVHPIELLATIYHAVGLSPATTLYNDLGQPRPLVQAEPVLSLYS
ncbi:DUF1501 domain-containing protein [bacterium]|nr:DUF1501 domain-containing protein [bacterium]